MKKLVLPSLVILFLLISSSQTYEEQSLNATLQTLLPNKPFEDLLSSFSIWYFGTVISVEERGYYLFIEFIIRKGAHFFLFGLLALGFYLVLSFTKYRFIIALLLTVAFASFDEYHQFLTGGRTPSYKDVLLDSMGACVFLSFVHLKNKYRRGTSRQ
ncbi:VanZ family protein [Lysinibacillus xylanilyticus]|uniref:VanZ family protein n=1 Tax=Lysinibacillus xylanilyticus TaxID=582475 RepID=UPI00380F899E